VIWLTRSSLHVSVHNEPADECGMYARIRTSQTHAPVPVRGSSLIELVVVFSVVGMASAFAIPRYTRLGNQARATQVRALSGALRGATERAHRQYIASGSTLAAATLDGKAVALENGYPDASSRGIRAVLIDRAGFTIKSSPDSVVFMKKGAAVATQCAVTYSVAQHLAPESSIKLETDGC
jgi:MSHA pilin protein MshA